MALPRPGELLRHGRPQAAPHGGIEALLFDFGGVIIEIDFDRVFARWAQLAGVETAQIRGRFSHGEAYQRLERGEIDARAYFASLRRELGIGLDDAQFADGWARVFGGEHPEVVAALRDLGPRIPLYLFSNTNRAHHDVWGPRYAPALAPFRRQFLSFEMGKRKPDKDAFEHVASEIGLPARSILFLDDTRANVEGAIAAGLDAVWTPGSREVLGATAPWLAGGALGA